MEEGETGCGWESPYGRVHEMEREREGAREQGEGGGGYPPTERGERRQSLPVAKDSWSLGGWAPERGWGPPQGHRRQS